MSEYNVDSRDLSLLLKKENVDFNGCSYPPASIKYDNGIIFDSMGSAIINGFNTGQINISGTTITAILHNDDVNIVFSIFDSRMNLDFEEIIESTNGTAIYTLNTPLSDTYIIRAYGQTSYMSAFATITIEES
jgi:hypothetical protein